MVQILLKCSSFSRAGHNRHRQLHSAMRVVPCAPLTGGSAFTKDTVYLHGLLSVHTFFAGAEEQRLQLCRNLFAGKMALHDVIALSPILMPATSRRRCICRRGCGAPAAWPALGVLVVRQQDSPGSGRGEDLVLGL